VGVSEVEDSEEGVAEEAYEDKFKEKIAEALANAEEESVGLMFPRWGREVAVEEEWQWDVCGSLIGGKDSNRLCIKRLSTDRGLTHCGTTSHAFKKAELREGFRYIPSSTGDRTNTRSAFLYPSVDAGSLPEAYMESLQNLLPPEQWVSYFAMLPAQSEMGEFSEDHQEAAATTLTKGSRKVSFSYTPASKRPRLAELVSGPLGASVNLAAQFKEEGYADEVDLFSEDLEANIPEEWVEGEGGEI
jgi:hypothetical protein